jgi:hypothetical protein
MGDAKKCQNPRRRMAKTQQKKLESWEVVKDVRVISEGASRLLQLIAGIGDQTNATRLLALRDILSGQTLMQLSLWLNQYVYSLYVNNIY